ncbi:thiol-disulfide oxidoreductase DCC family protein [Ascidiimonas sp. W6]|uniref:thiol-disulfide oxidoreductase DCC family protein n=1 Tax=Ascidiimonas meishanensis TaxID=3128903 RepID=UPI0030EF4C7E
MYNSTNTPVLIYDGVCNLCNGVVEWALNAAPHKTFDFVPFQSQRGQQLLKKYNFPLERLDTLIYIEGDDITTHSDAFLRMTLLLPNYKWLGNTLKWIPSFLRNSLYKTASKYRIQWFGNRTKSCTVVF